MSAIQGRMDPKARRAEVPAVHARAPRRALSYVGGEIETGGDPAAAKLLAHALDVPHAEGTDIASAPTRDAGTPTRAEDPHRAHVHGFHTYPARMHPLTASRLVEAFCAPRGIVLDPFCGSGTVLVEAAVAGRDAIGTDLNPLAVRLARCKTRLRTPEQVARLVSGAREIAAYADDRRKTRAGATRRYWQEDVELFDAHVLLELDGLRAGIEQASDVESRADLQLVLSAILVKMSKKRGDTSERTAPARLAAGYPARLFVKKTEELGRRFCDLARLVPSPHPRASVALDDATALRTVHKCSAIITSPPYVATYDYVAHHALRMRWLGIDARAFEAGEIGARRRYAAMSPEEARAAWRDELGAFLRASSRVLPPGAPLVLLMADSAVGKQALRAEEIVADIAEACRFLPVARASQRRAHFHGPTLAAFAKVPRAEHALLLTRV